MSLFRVMTRPQYLLRVFLLALRSDDDDDDDDDQKSEAKLEICYFFSMDPLQGLVM